MTFAIVIQSYFSDYVWLSMAGTGVGSEAPAGGQDGHTERGLLLSGEPLQRPGRVQQHTAG